MRNHILDPETRKKIEELYRQMEEDEEQEEEKRGLQEFMDIAAIGWQFSGD